MTPCRTKAAEDSVVGFRRHIDCVSLLSAGFNGVIGMEGL